MKLLLRYIDAALCLLVTFLMYEVFPLGQWMNESVALTVLVVFFYYCSYAVTRAIIVPCFFRGGLCCVGSLGLLIVMVLLLVGIISTQAGHPFHVLMSFCDDQEKVQMSRECAWLLFLDVQAFALSAGVLRRLALERIRLLNAEHDRDHAALLLCCAQLNPHFLYNTLNSLYGLIVSGSDKAEHVLMRIADMARATSTMTQHEFVSIDEEVSYIRNYIDLQCLRMEHPERIRFQYDCHADAMIAPMLLTPFVGNALKYGCRDESQGNIDIVLTIDEQARLTLDTTNPVPPADADDAQDAGTGIANSRRRLALLYPDRHHLSILQQDGLFKVHLEVCLDSEQQKNSPTN